MQTTTRRLLLYGASVPLLGALVWAGFVHREEADIGTLLGSADTQLRLAMSLPQRDRDGRPFAARQQLLDAAGEMLSRARVVAPDSAVVAEFDGLLCQLRGEPRAAAAHFRRARGLPDCGQDQRTTLLFNEARNLATAGDRDGALAVYRSAGDDLSPQLRAQRAVEQAQVLHDLGRDAEAREQLAAAADSDQPMAWLQAGLLYVRLGDDERADAMFDKSRIEVPIADYHRAHLKLVQGDVDTCLRLLERAAAAVPAEVTRLVQQDPSAWQALAGDARFARLTETNAATPGR